MAPRIIDKVHRRNRGLIVSAVVFGIFANLLMLTGPLFMLQVYDRVLAARAEETLLALFLLVMFLFTIYGILEYSRGRVLARAGARLQSLLNDAVFSEVLENAALRRSADSKGDSLRDLEAVRLFYSSPVLLSLLDVPWAPVFLAAIFIFHPLLGWLGLAGAAILIAVTLLNQSLTKKRAGEAQRRSALAHRFATDMLNGGEFVWAQAMRPAMLDRWIELQDAAVEQRMTANDRTAAFSSFSKAFRLLLQSAMLALGALLVLQNEISAGAMIAASIMLGRGLAPVEQTLSQWSAVQRALFGWRNLVDLLRDREPAADLLDLPPPASQLAVENLTLATGPVGRNVLSGISFRVEPGEAVGIIGRSGSGKTTLARAIVGLIRPAGGQIRLGGARLDQYGPGRLGRHIGYLPQNMFLFEGTIAENIAQMEHRPDAARVVAAAQAAGVHEIILDLPNGYDTVVRGKEAGLSGGQIQRLGLARAIFNEPALLVLDEPNSALDAAGSESMNAVVAGLKATGKSVVIMTHRPTAISCCDKLLVLDQGRAAMFGTRDEVIKSMMRNASDIQKVMAGGRGG